MVERADWPRWQKRQRIQEIHALAKAQLTEKQKGFRPRKLLNELEEIATGGLRQAPSYYESKLLIWVGLEGRAARARRAMSSLRRVRKERGEIEEFMAFEALLKATVGRDFLFGHDYEANFFADADQGAVWSEVERIVGWLQRDYGDVFLNSGTLLGVVRDQRLIAHDDDIDLAIRLRAESAEDAAVEWLKLRDRLAREGHLADNTPEHDAGILKLKSRGGHDVDLFPCWIERGGAYIYPHTFGEMSERQIYPLKSCTVTGLPVPAEPERMLAINYGEGWQEPDPYFSFPWAGAAKKFNRFLGTLRETEPAQ